MSTPPAALSLLYNSVNVVASKALSVPGTRPSEAEEATVVAQRIQFVVPLQLPEKVSGWE